MQSWDLPLLGPASLQVCSLFFSTLHRALEAWLRWTAAQGSRAFGFALSGRGSLAGDGWAGGSGGVLTPHLPPELPAPVSGGFCSGTLLHTAFPPSRS